MAPITRLAFLVLVAAASQFVGANNMNYFTNESGITLNLIASCSGCASQSFAIAPASFDSFTADYTDYSGQVQIVLSIGSGQSSSLFIGSDQSIVAYNNADNSGVDIFIAVYGTRADRAGSAQATLFP